MYPLELARTRMAMRGKISKYGLFEIMGQTIKNEGFKGLYKGIVPGMVGIVIYKGFGFSIYETFYKYNRKLPIPDFALNFMSGSLSSILSQFGKIFNLNLNP